MSDDGHADGQDESGHDHEHGHGHDHDHSHDHHHHASGPWTAAVLVVSSTRDAGDDESGQVARSLLADAGHDVTEVSVVGDDAGAIREAVGSRVGTVDLVVTTGGTGLTPDDVTVDAVAPMLDPELPGVGEYFRRRSHEEIGTAAMLTRATGGVCEGTAVYAFPGSPAAVELGVREVVLPELDHVLGLARR